MDRNQLYTNLQNLPDNQFYQVLLRLKDPASNWPPLPDGQLPPMTSRRSDRVIALFEWADSQVGCGLDNVEKIYTEVVNSSTFGHKQGAPTRTSQQPVATEPEQNDRKEIKFSHHLPKIILGTLLTTLIIPLLLMENPPFWLPIFAKLVPRSQKENNIDQAPLPIISSPSKVIDEVAVNKAKSLDPVIADYSITTETNPHYATFLDNAVGKRYGERLTGNISPQSNDGVPGRGWVRIRCLEGQNIIFTSIQGSAGIVLYNPDGYPVELNPSRFLPEGQSIQGVLSKIRQGQPKYLVYKIELQNQTSSAMTLDMSIICE